MRKISEYLSVARSELNDRAYARIPAIFDYYLETTLFVPRVDWETFQQFHAGYQGHRLEDIILNHFADLLFCYADAGIFQFALIRRRAPAKKCALYCKRCFWAKGFV